MVLTTDALVKIFTGMDLGAEKIQENFGKLLQENQDQDSTIATIFPKHQKWLGKCGDTFDQRNWDDLDEGIYTIAWWNADQTPDHSYGDPTVNSHIKSKMTGSWGTLLVYGRQTDNHIADQIAITSGGVIQARDNVGNHGWNPWIRVELN